MRYSRCSRVFRGQRPVYAIDLPGFGFSERTDRVYYPELYADTLIEWIESYLPGSAQPVDLIALSLSCEFAAIAASVRPRAVPLPHGDLSHRSRGFRRSRRIRADAAAEFNAGLEPGSLRSADHSRQHSALAAEAAGARAGRGACRLRLSHVASARRPICPAALPQRTPEHARPFVNSTER
jgi:pimeloyl-ACP methyl ester carboxylesterase